MVCAAAVFAEKRKALPSSVCNQAFYMIASAVWARTRVACFDEGNCVVQPAFHTLPLLWQLNQFIFSHMKKSRNGTKRRPHTAYTACTLRYYGAPLRFNHRQICQLKTNSFTPHARRNTSQVRPQAARFRALHYARLFILFVCFVSTIISHIQDPVNSHIKCVKLFKVKGIHRIITRDFKKLY